jgi:hypothetical protein
MTMPLSVASSTVTFCGGSRMKSTIEVEGTFTSNHTFFSTGNRYSDNSYHLIRRDIKFLTDMATKFTVK